MTTSDNPDKPELPERPRRQMSRYPMHLLGHKELSFCTFPERKKTTNQKCGKLVIDQSLFEFPMHVVHERNALLLGKN